MSKSLRGIRVARLAADGVERVGLEVPRQEAQEAGTQTDLLSLHVGQIQARSNDLDEAGTFAVRDAGAEVVDQEVVIDGNLISSRSTRRPAGVTSSERPFSWPIHLQILKHPVSCRCKSCTASARPVS